MLNILSRVLQFFCNVRITGRNRFPSYREVFVHFSLRPLSLHCYGLQDVFQPFFTVYFILLAKKIYVQAEMVGKRQDRSMSPIRHQRCCSSSLLSKSLHTIGSPEGFLLYTAVEYPASMVHTSISG